MEDLHNLSLTEDFRNLSLTEYLENRHCTMPRLPLLHADVFGSGAAGEVLLESNTGWERPTSPVRRCLGYRRRDLFLYVWGKPPVHI